MTASVTALVVSPSRFAAGALVWTHRHLFGPAEVHVRSAGRFLTADEALALIPWAREGLSYQGTLLDALDERRIGLVLPLAEPDNGTLPGFWEFLGVPYAGCHLTGLVLASDPEFQRAVGGAASHSLSSEETRVPVALVGGATPLAASLLGHDAEEAALSAFLRLGLEGWALAEVSRQPQGWAVDRIEVHPDLDGPFLSLVESKGGGLTEVLLSLIHGARTRHGAEAALKRHYRDRI